MSLDPSFQAHELVYCAKCFLPYDQQVNITEVDIPEDASTRSWYLTNCGHALCSQCLFPNGLPPTIDADNKFPCPKCQNSATIVVLSAELPPEILPYFRSVTEMSEEVLGAIKFQHQNLLHLVDHLRDRIAPMTKVVRQARDELEKRKLEQTRIEELEKTVVELRKRLDDREAMPPPSLPSVRNVPSTPANFRKDLAARSVMGPPVLRVSRPTTSPPKETFIDIQKYQSRHDDQRIYGASIESRSRTSIESGHGRSLESTHFSGRTPPRNVAIDSSTTSQQYYLESPQQYPSTPQRQVARYDGQPVDSPFLPQQNQRTPFPTRRVSTRPFPPSTPSHFTADHVRPVSAMVSASTGRQQSPIPMGPPIAEKSPYRTSAIVTSSRGRGPKTSSADFVAGLTAHGGRR